MDKSCKSGRLEIASQKVNKEKRIVEAVGTLLDEVAGPFSIGGLVLGKQEEETVLTAKYGLKMISKMRRLDSKVPYNWPHKIRLKYLLELCDDDHIREQLQEVLPILPQVHTNPQTSNTLQYLGPPTGTCLKCEVPLSTNNKPVVVRYVDFRGCITRKTKVNLRCHNCKTNYGFDKFGTKTDGYRFYDQERDAIMPTDAVLVDRVVFNLQWSLSRGYLVDSGLEARTTLKENLKRSITDVGGLVINMSQNELGLYWAEKYAAYMRDYQRLYGLARPQLPCALNIGWQEKAEDIFVINGNLQMTKDGDIIPPEDNRVAFVQKHFKDIPVPTSTNKQHGPVVVMYGLLGDMLPTNTYMASLFMGGAALMVVHYGMVKRTFHQVPIPLLLGQPNTCKTFLAKVCAAMLGGLHKSAIYTNLSAAKLAELMGKALFFVFNDPDVKCRKSKEVLFALVSKSFEDGKDSNLLREVRPNTVPVITANPPVMKAIKQCGERITSRLAILPLTTECNVDLDLAVVDDALDQAGNSLACMVSLGDDMSGCKARVSEVQAKLSDLLPHDGLHRVLKSYAMLVAFTELFMKTFSIKTSEDDLWAYVETVLVRQAIEAHQVYAEAVEATFSTVSWACLRLATDEELTTIYKVEDGAVAVRLGALTKLVRDRQTQLEVKAQKLRTEVEALGGKSRSSLRFPAPVGVTSAYLLPPGSISDDLWEKLTEVGAARKRGRPAKGPVEQSVGENGGESTVENRGESTVENRGENGGQSSDTCADMEESSDTVEYRSDDSQQGQDDSIVIIGGRSVTGTLDETIPLLPREDIQDHSVVVELEGSANAMPILQQEEQTKSAMTPSTSDMDRPVDRPAIEACVNECGLTTRLHSEFLPTVTVQSEPTEGDFQKTIQKMEKKRITRKKMNK